MRHARAIVLPVLALAVVVVALVMPVGAMLVRSFQVNQLVLKGGRVLEAAGDIDVKETPTGRTYILSMQAKAGGEKVQQMIDGDRVAETRTAWSLEHYARLWDESRTWGLLRNSAELSLGAALLALLLGIPVGWLLGRTNLPGRRLLAVLCLGPAILPPLIVAMGAARPLEIAVTAALGATGQHLQLATGILVFGLVFFPLVAFLVARALIDVPVGPWEAALQLGGRRAAFRHVVLPAMVPSLFGAAALVFVLAWSDFAVPDYLGVTLKMGTTPMYVFPTEILLQWKQEGNAGRAVATGAPYMVLAALLLVLAVVLLRKSPILAGGEGRGGRPLLRLGRRGKILGVVLVVLVLLVAFALPMGGIASWGLGGGEIQVQPNGTTVAKPVYAHLFDVAGAFARTPGLDEDMARWLKSGLGAALIATLVSIVLVRWALRGGRFARGTVLLVGLLPLAVPGLVLTVGTHVLWLGFDVDWVDRTMLRSALALTARFLPFALVATWLALRQVRPGHEEAASLGGAGPIARARRIWLPLAWRGLIGAALIVLVLALREIDAVILVDPRILPLRLYDKIHFTRFADEATICFVYVGVLLLPALLAALFLRRRRT